MRVAKKFMTNYFMQGGDGKEYGPVGAEQLRQWVAEGRANAQTQVRPAEGGSYLALGLVAELNAAGSAASSSTTSAFAQGKPATDFFMRGGDGKEYGPVTAAQLRQWVAEGRANAQTQVRATEGGPYRALGMVPELNSGAAATGYTPLGGGPSLAHTLAQNSGQAGLDSTQLIKRLAAILAESAGWMKFFAVLSIISGALTMIGPGIVIGWVQIWLGLVLWKAATLAQQATFTGAEADLAQALDRVRFYFKLMAIFLLVMVVVMIIAFVFFFGSMMAIMSAVGAHGM